VEIRCLYRIIQENILQSTILNIFRTATVLEIVAAKLVRYVKYRTYLSNNNSAASCFVGIFSWMYKVDLPVAFS
jgi:hypothetical protein